MIETTLHERTIWDSLTLSLMHLISMFPADTSKLNVNDLHVVLEEVHDAHSQWQGIGLQLRLASPVLEGIEQQYSKTEDRLREILKQWLKQATPVPCWDALVEALKTKTVNEPKLAKQLSLSHGKCVEHVYCYTSTCAHDNFHTNYTPINALRLGNLVHEARQAVS